VRILIVDDNRDLADNLAELLSDEGHETLVAYGAEDALALVGDPPPIECAVLDVRMSGMDGVELSDRIRSRLPGTPCLLMTAFTRDQRLAEARESGITVVLSKPFAPDELLRALPPAA